eukprot:CAMPEP_0183703124 /NCGR_PEP_ID=MMETSP0737-20130205/983_1 /TAXON_ID=385413 /ORGANISM="Thalassiosira miniscula, Strain CCMP1093" /LENGTH=833 /DNA_ID=CAMNT_0025929829 /DNA_START=229 /DNA_END=2727 /DNA_ORIENTATION=-
MATNIQVAVRVRPFLPFEAGSKTCIEVLPGEDHFGDSGEKLSQGKSVHIGSGSSSSGGVHGKDGHKFTFDRCFSGLATQVEIYTTLVVPLLKCCLEGYNATTLAYGQTGAGKTYTTLGPATSPDFFSSQNNKQSEEFKSVGILPRALRDLFMHLEEKRDSLNGQENNNPAADEHNNAINGDSNHGSDNGIAIPATKSPVPKSKSKQKQPFEYQVKLQFLELYGEEIRDLLAASTTTKTKIVVRDHAGDAEALGATWIPVASAQEAMVCLTRGMLRRVTGATAMNAESSRSHAIMSIMLEQTTRTSDEVEGEAVVKRKSKYNFVDLAGAERSKRTHAKGQRLKEGININKGLLVLGNVISALASGDKFVPFRDSKLTRLLRGCLGGNHKTLLIACASPSHKNAEESLNCLRYANRAKNIQNKAEVNVDPHSRLVNALRGQVTALAGELLRLSNRGGGKVDNERFAVEMLEVLVKGGKEAQSVAIGGKPKGGQSSASASESKESEINANAETESASIKELTAELEKTRISLKETKLDLLDKSGQLQAVLLERDDLRRATEQSADSAADYSMTTPSRAIGNERRESIRDILTTLSTADDGASDAGTLSLDAISEGGTEEGTEEKTEKKQNGFVTPKKAPGVNEELQIQQIKELTEEVETLRSHLDQYTEVLNEYSDELETAMAENELLRDKLRNTPDIDEKTIHYIVKNITSYDDQRMEAFQSENDEEESLSGESSSSSTEFDEDEDKMRKNEEMETFASAMFSTGKFLVDRELFPDSIVCFETVLEVRREIYGWDDPLVGDALHMEGFVRSKMGDYDRALMLLWDALRIRKIASE